MLSPNTKINLTIAATATGVAGIVMATVWGVNLVNDIRSNQTKVSEKVDALAAQFSDFKDGSYTKSLAAEVALRNAILNPGVSFSDPRDPTKVIYVDSGRITRGQPKGE